MSGNINRSIQGIALAMLTVSCGHKAMVLEPRYPTEPMSLEPETGITVLIGDIQDGRSFSSETEMLKQPCMWDEEPLTDDSSRVIGARAAQGKTPTNIYLPEGEKVEEIVKDLLEVALRQAGYEVIEEGEPDLVVGATVDQFWVWMTPGAMTIRVESIVQTTVTVEGDGVAESFNIDGYHDSRDVGKSPESYVFAMNEGLFDLYTKLATTLIGAELTPVKEEEKP